MLCKNCGNKIKRNANYCNKCGQKIEREIISSNGLISTWNLLSKKQKIIICVLFFLILAFAENETKKNSSEYQLYEIWSKDINSQWVVHEIEDFDDIEITKEENEDGTYDYYSDIDILAENIIEETVEKTVHCQGFENRQGKVVEKYSGCYILADDE